MKPFPFYPNVQSPQIANFLLVMLMSFHAWQALADEVFSGLPITPLGTAVLELEPDGSLIVSIEDDIELGGVIISSGNVEGLSTALEATVVTAEALSPGEGLRSAITGWVDASTEGLAQIDLIKADSESPALEAIPDFSGWQAATYELTLFHEDTVVFQTAGFSGSSGELLVGPADLTVEWLNEGLVVLTGLTGAIPSTQPDEPPIAADTAVFRAEDPAKECEGIHAVTWTPKGLSTFRLIDTRFILEGRRFRGHGMVDTHPWISTIELEDLGSSQPWSLDVAISRARSWSMSMDTSGTGQGLQSLLEISASATLSDSEEPEEWAVLISGQEEAQLSAPSTVTLSGAAAPPNAPAFPDQPAEEGQALTPWQVSFDLALPEGESQTIRILNQGAGVTSLSGGSDLFALFHTPGMPGIVTAGMTEDLSDLLPAESTLVNDSEPGGIGLDAGPMLYLRFPEPIQITLGDFTFLGDQIVGARAAAQPPALEAGAIELSDVQITALGIPDVVLEGPAVQLKGSPTAVLACQTTVKKIACRPLDSANKLEYRLLVEQPQGGAGACLDISVLPNSLLTNRIPYPPPLQQGSNTFNWSFCLSAGTSCQAGFTAQYSGPTAVLQSEATLVQGSPPQGPPMSTTVTTVNQVFSGLPSCPASIQICDDEDSIFADNFECGLGRWSTVVGAVP